MADIGWGILGTGAVAEQFAEALSALSGARLAAVGSREPARAEAFAAQFAVRRAHGSYPALVRDPAVDVVYVATPNALHEEHALLAIEAGKAVLCEKPFALDAASGERVVAAARRKGVFCMEGMWMRFSPAFREALALVRRGELGDVRLVDAQLGFPYPADPASPRLAPPGGGALLDLGPYPLSLAQAFLGRPERVQGDVVAAATGADEQVSAVLGYGGGRQALVAASFRAQLANAATVHGTAGVLTLEAPLWFPHRLALVATPPAGGMRRGRRGPLARLRTHPWTRGLVELRARLRRRVLVRRVAGNGYAEEAAEVQRCLAAGARESPDLPLDATLEVLATMDAVRRAAAGRG